MLRSPPATEEESAKVLAGACAVAERTAASRNNFAKAFTLEAQGQRITPNGLHTPKKGEWPGVKLRTEG